MLAAATLAPALAQAQTIDFSTGTASRAFDTSSLDPGQSFTVPAGVTLITSFGIGVASNAGNPAAYTVFLDTFPVSTPGGVASGAFSGAPAFGAGTNSYRIDTITAPGAGVPVTPGQVLVIKVQTAFPSQVFLPTRFNDVYVGGSVRDDSGATPSDEAFSRVAFANPPTPVPTMSEWAMILLGVALAASAVFYIRPKQVTT